MDELRTVLREGDPAPAGAGLSRDDLDGMRRAVLGADRERHAARGPMFVGAAAVAAVVIGTAVWWRAPVAPVAPVPVDRADIPLAERANRQQLIFATAGGTRIIWVFDQRPLQEPRHE